jgi:hypothetical protein
MNRPNRRRPVRVRPVRTADPITGADAESVPYDPTVPDGGRPPGAGWRFSGDTGEGGVGAWVRALRR